MKRSPRIFRCLLLAAAVLFTAPAAYPAEWSGELAAAARGFADYGNPADGEVEARPRTRLELRESSEKADLVIRLLFDGRLRDDGSPDDEAAALPEKLVDEAYVRAYLGRFDLEAGLMKIVWGKGDDLHVVDVLNPTDYADFVNTAYLERRKAELLFRLVGRLGDSSGLELVYGPRFTPDAIPREGRWTPADVLTLQAAVASRASALAADLAALYESGGMDTTAAAALAAAEAERLLSDPLSENVPSSIADGTFGARWTLSAGGWDLGLLYAYTFHRIPSVDLNGFLLDPSRKIILTYDRLHVFGAEAAAVLAGFNLRAEAAYCLTGDTDGTDPRVRNNQAGFVAGFDRDILAGKLNLNVQVRGLATLNPGGIEDNGFAADTEYREDGVYTETLAAVRLSGSFMRDRLKPETSLVVGLEHGDLRLEPELVYKPSDDLELGARFVLFAGDRDGTFGRFRDNDFGEVFVSFRF